MQQIFPSSEWNSTTYLCAEDSRQDALVACVYTNGTTKEEFSEAPLDMLDLSGRLTVPSHTPIDRRSMWHYSP
jgi:hypothetical protein